MFRIRMLPADYGDSLWVEYGPARKPYRILIDAGTINAWDAIRACIENDLPKRRRWFDAFLISHVDTDHIDTAVKLLNSDSLKLEFGEIWFNGWRQIDVRPADMLGAQQGEYVSALIEKREIPLNAAWDSGTIVVPDKGPLPTAKLPGGMTATLLSPGPRELRKLRTAWKKVMGAKAGDAEAALEKLAATKKYRDVLGRRLPNIDKLADSPFEPDTAVPNGSSIVVLLQYDNKRCLLAADSHPDVLERGIDRLLASEGTARLKLDAFKVPHHGSRHNNSVSLYQKLNCRRYLISTNGKRFEHPHPEGIARIIRYGGKGIRLYFNYDSDQTRIWNATALKEKRGYQVTMRPESARSLDVDL